MARPDEGAGPQVGQMVHYNNAGVIVPAFIYSVNVPNSTVGLLYAGAGGWTNSSAVYYDPGLGTSAWRYVKL